jgi:uncharacterized protein YjdB
VVSAGGGSVTMRSGTCSGKYAATGLMAALVVSCGGDDGGGIQGPAAVDAITLTAPTTEIQEGQTVQLTATALDADRNVLGDKSFEWTSGIGTVATVSQTGLVTGHEKGQSEIRATTEGVTGSLVITVHAAPLPDPTIGRLREGP